MKPFEYFRPTSVAQAISLLSRHQEKAALLAGGSDLFGLMEDRIEGPKLKMPQYLIDIKGIKELNYIKEQKNSLRIGTTTTLSEIASSDLVAKRFPLLIQAASQVGVPQIRNVGTLGGNLCQRPRCWYFRGSLFRDCSRKGGSDCYAPGGENQYHAIIGGHNCYMVSPSDMAVALTTLNARLEIATPKGNGTVPIERFYVGPEKNPLRENILTPQEMLVSVEIPFLPNGSEGVYLKLKERQAFDFPIASVGVNLTLKNGVVSDPCIVFAGLAPFPLRAGKAEAVLKGKTLRDAIPGACGMATEGAEPLSRNRYKIDAAKGLLEEALGSLA